MAKILKGLNCIWSGVTNRLNSKTLILYVSYMFRALTTNDDDKDAYFDMYGMKCHG